MNTLWCCMLHTVCNLFITRKRYLNSWRKIVPVHKEHPQYTWWSPTAIFSSPAVALESFFNQ